MVLNMEPTKITADQICLVAQAHAFENLTKQLDKRNEYAMRLWKTKGIRNVTFKTPEEKEYRVETWWDSQSRNWITQTFDAVTGYEVPDESTGHYIAAEYTGEQVGASIAHFWAINRFMFAKRS
jgi:hypothetical protein